MEDETSRGGGTKELRYSESEVEDETEGKKRTITITGSLR